MYFIIWCRKNGLEKHIANLNVTCDAKGPNGTKVEGCTEKTTM